MQAFNIAALDEDMKVIETVRVQTSDSQSETSVEKLEGPKDRKIAALLINTGAHGYGKFCIDEMTLQALETKLHKIESSMERKLLLNMMYDLIKSGKMPASRVLKIILNNFEHETAVDVLQDTFRFVAPAILSKFLHNEVNAERSAQMFDLTMKIMKSGRFNEFPAAMETLITSAISFASNEEN